MVPDRPLEQGVLGHEEDVASHCAGHQGDVGVSHVVGNHNQWAVARDVLAAPPFDLGEEGHGHPGHLSTKVVVDAHQQSPSSCMILSTTCGTSMPSVSSL